MPVTGKMTEAGGSRLLNQIFGGTPMLVPTTWYVGYTVGDSDRVNVGAEPSGGGYQRAAVPNTRVNFDVPTNQAITNLLPIEWPVASSNQGTARSIVFFDSPNGGNPWFYFPLQSPKDMQEGDAMLVPGGGLTFEFATGGLSNYVKDRALGSLFGGIPMVTPTTYWLSYSTTAPGDNAPGTEPTMGGYSRVSMANNSGNWPPSATATKTNGTSIQWPEITAAQGLGVGFQIFDAATGGNLIAFCSSPGTIGLNAQVVPYLAANVLDIRVN